MAIANHIGSAHRSRADNFMPETVRFVSTCPKCLKERPQRGYTRAALVAFLLSGHKIEGYCVGCDEFWPIGASERAAMAGELEASMQPRVSR
jgi:hypothetical protein